ncbi:MAG: HAD family hydrolase [Caldilineaceae bacterium]|nr:HAD family hydrolase [Caldilineaceae bacterium]
MSTENPTPANPEAERPPMEPLTPEEIERFLARVRAEGRALTSEEQYALFGPREATPAPAPVDETVEEMEPAHLGEQELQQLSRNFFPEFSQSDALPSHRLVRGVIFDFDHTLAYLARPLDELMAEGAKAAEAYMRSTGMDDLPADFWHNIIEARRFAQEKSEEEAEEHIADDAMSFLVQFFGYPASKMDPAVLRQAVELFYAPEMTAWRLHPGVLEMLQALHAEKYKLAILTNYNCDRVFQRTIDYLGLRPYLDVVLDSAAVEYRKPDARFFQLVLERWDALPYEVVVVGDSLVHDIKGGIALGALTVQTTFATDAQVVHDNAQVADAVVADAQLAEWTDLVRLVEIWAE